LAAKLSDAIKNLSSEIPETKVLEGKLDQMTVLEPKVNKALAKLSMITSMPTPSAVKSSETETKSMMAHIDKAADGAAKVAQVDAGSTAQQKGKVGVHEEPEIVEAPSNKAGAVAQADDQQSFLAVKKAIEKVKTGVDNKDTKATTSALKDAISKADAYTGQWAEAPSSAAPKEAVGNFIAKEANTTAPVSTDAVKEANVEQSLESPLEQDRMKSTIQDALENEGIWAKDAEMKKEIALELLK
jgi:hypothetical protein